MARLTKPKVGRPSEYKKDYARRTAHMIYLGLKNSEICVNLDINEDTFYTWLKTNKEFSEAVAKARQADGDVAAAFRKRAVGFTKKTEQLFMYKGAVMRATTKQYYPPDVGAASKWLKVKHPDKWGDQIGSVNQNNGGGQANIYVDAETMALAGADTDADVDDTSEEREAGSD